MSDYYVASTIDLDHTPAAVGALSGDLLRLDDGMMAVKVSGRRFARIVKTLRAKAVPHRIETLVEETPTGALRRPERRAVTVLLAAGPSEPAG